MRNFFSQYANSESLKKQARAGNRRVTWDVKNVSNYQNKKKIHGDIVTFAHFFSSNFMSTSGFSLFKIVFFISSWDLHQRIMQIIWNCSNFFLSQIDMNGSSLESAPFMECKRTFAFWKRKTFFSGKSTVENHCKFIVL